MGRIVKTREFAERGGFRDSREAANLCKLIVSGGLNGCPTPQKVKGQWAPSEDVLTWIAGHSDEVQTALTGMRQANLSVQDNRKPKKVRFDPHPEPPEKAKPPKNEPPQEPVKSKNKRAAPLKDGTKPQPAKPGGVWAFVKRVWYAGE